MQDTQLRTLAQRCRWARLKRGLSQKEAAKLAEVSESVIANVESNRQQKTIRKLTAVANALCVDPVWLAEGKGSPYAPFELESKPASSPDLEIKMVLEWLAVWRLSDEGNRSVIESAFAVARDNQQRARIRRHA